MSKAVNVGDRVGCISNTEGKTAFIFGYGKYVGRRLPRTAGGVMAQSIVEVVDEYIAEYKKKQPNPLSEQELKQLEDYVTQVYGNPCLELDNGKLVFGCECWWGPEEQVKAQLAMFEKVEVIDIDEARKAASS